MPAVSPSTWEVEAGRSFMSSSLVHIASFKAANTSQQNGKALSSSGKKNVFRLGCMPL